MKGRLRQVKWLEELALDVVLLQQQTVCLALRLRKDLDLG